MSYSIKCPFPNSQLPLCCSPGDAAAGEQEARAGSCIQQHCCRATALQTEELWRSSGRKGHSQCFQGSFTKQLHPTRQHFKASTKGQRCITHWHSQQQLCNKKGELLRAARADTDRSPHTALHHKILPPNLPTELTAKGCIKL